MLDWEKLLSGFRRKDVLKKSSGASGVNKEARLEPERDYDRILFATPIRRLADKTQVFPLEPNDSVRNRLTHSHEVANLARSIGVRLAFNHSNEVFGSASDKLKVQRTVPAMLAAIGLAHDIGNPPFGHQGEVAIKEWYTENRENFDVEHDFIEFDGNPQSFRLLTRLQIVNDDYGLNLTVGTLAALLKYPSLQSSANRGGYEKFGVFMSEQDIAEEVWEKTGLGPGRRHPFAHIMEACDDMAYAVIDAEDTVKKGYASFNDLIDHLSNIDDELTNSVVKEAKKKHEEFKEDKELSSSELNEISMQMFRVYALSFMVDAVTEAFVANIGRILSEDDMAGFELIKQSRAKRFCKAMKAFDFRHGFKNAAVLRLELSGSNYIKQTMDMLWSAISEEESAFEKYAKSQISESYQRVHARNLQMSQSYRDQQLLVDFVSGMTEKYLIQTHDDLRSLQREKL